VLYKNLDVVIISATNCVLKTGVYTTYTICSPVSCVYALSKLRLRYVFGFSYFDLVVLGVSKFTLKDLMITSLRSMPSSY